MLWGGPKILYVCDWPEDSGEIEALLREIAGAQGLRVTGDPQAALQFVQAERNPIVVAHLRGGAAAATHFLNLVWQHSAQSARFLIDSQIADPATLVQCVLGAHQFIAKPVTRESLAAALDRAESVKRFIRKPEVQTLVSKMRTLPSRPTLYLEIRRELRSPGAGASAVAALISKDLGVTAKLLQLANSAFFGAQQPVSEVRDAVLMLGLGLVESLVLSIEAFARFDKLKPLYFSSDRVWKHSQAVAEAARRICQATRQPSEAASLACTAALLHDIGKLALAQNFEQEYQELMRRADEKKLPLCEAEAGAFGITHADAGAYLLAVWGLPLPVVEAVANHHLGSGVFKTGLSPGAVLHLAQQIVANPHDLEAIVGRYPPELGLRTFLPELRAVFAAPPSSGVRPAAMEGAGPKIQESGKTPARGETPVGKFFRAVARLQWRTH